MLMKEDLVVFLPGYKTTTLINALRIWTPFFFTIATLTNGAGHVLNKQNTNIPRTSGKYTAGITHTYMVKHVAVIRNSHLKNVLVFINYPDGLDRNRRSFATFPLLK